MGSFNRLLKCKQLLQCQVLEFRQFQKHSSFPSSTAFPLHWAPSLWQLVVLSGQKCPRGTFSGCRGAVCLQQDTPCEQHSPVLQGRVPKSTRGQTFRKFYLWRESVSHSIVSDFAIPWTVRLLCSWNSPGKNTGVGCHFLLQGNLPNPGIEPGSPVLQANSLPIESPGKPLIQPVKHHQDFSIIQWAIAVLSPTVSIFVWGWVSSYMLALSQF